MFLFVFGIYQNIINEDYHKLVKLRHENKIHQVHEVSWGIGQTERHDQVSIQTISGSKSSLWNIFRTDLYLMIAGSEIYLREYFSSRKLIKK
jgi:hypothetical protein